MCWPAALDRELGALLAPLGLTPEDGGGSIVATGSDRYPGYAAPIGLIGALAQLAKAVPIAALGRDRDGRGQDIGVDLDHAAVAVSPFALSPALLSGYPVVDEDPYNAFNMDFYRAADDRHLVLLNPTPRLRERAARVLGVRNSRATVAGAVAGWASAELETALQEAGAAAAAVRTAAEWRAHPQHAYLAGQPVVSVTRIGDAPAETAETAETGGPGARPLAGIRALGLADQIAGAQVGSSLAEFGADALNTWRPGAFESNRAYVYGNLGVRSCLLELTESGARGRFTDLLADADVFYSNRRPPVLAALGLDATSVAALRPGIVHTTVTAFGAEGPWAGRAGFDPHAVGATGLALLGGDRRAPRLPPSGILNDFVAGWLAAAGTVAALWRRAREGGSWRVQVSLARCSMWFAELAARDDLPRAIGAKAAAPLPRYRADTPLGALSVLGSPLAFTRAVPGYARLLEPRGASRASWAPTDWSTGVTRAR